MNSNITANSTVSLGLCAKDAAITITEQLLSIFYIFSPYEHTKDNADEVPNYEVALIPAIGILVITEQIIRLIKSHDLSRFQDIVINIGASLLFTLARSLLLGVVVVVFSWVHTNFRIVDLPLYSIWTWLFSLLLVEFTYYWTHRALHEINILWAAHQFHHMAEDVNITTTVRDSVVDLILYDIFPLPLAMIVPPPILVVHIQFSLIYQIWLHNEVIGNLGPIEYIINTPRQHRVHHGKNPYCIDKNYGALLMIWDRIFGTYQTEKEKIVFGVVSATPKTFDSMTLQFGYYKDVINKFQSVDGFWNKMSALFKGPGWGPGKPRLGLIKEVPEPDPAAPKYSYDPFIPLWKKFYVLIHGTIIMIAFLQMADHPFIRYSSLKGFMGILYIVLLLTSIGAIFDARKFAAHLEIFRCLIYFPFDYYFVESVEWAISSNEKFVLSSSLWMIRISHILSIIFWLGYLFAAKPSHSDTKVSLKDVESVDSTEKPKTTNFERLLFGLGILTLFLSFSFVYTYNIVSCKNLINYIIVYFKHNIFGFAFNTYN